MKLQGEQIFTVTTITAVSVRVFPDVMALGSEIIGEGIGQWPDLFEFTSFEPYRPEFEI